MDKPEIVIAKMIGFLIKQNKSYADSAILGPVLFCFVCSILW